MGWQWHQLDHVQIICTPLQTDKHASISSLSFYRPDALPAAQPTANTYIIPCNAYKLTFHHSGSRSPQIWTVISGRRCLV